MRRNKEQIFRLGLTVLLLTIIITGYGGLCKKKSDDNVIITGSSGDTTAPTVSATNPNQDAIAIPRTRIITATFSEAMDSSTITNSTFTLVWSGGVVTGTVGYDAVSLSAVFTPTAKLARFNLHTATITTGVKNSAGNALAADYVWNFTTVYGWYGAELVETDDTGNTLDPHIAVDTKGNATVVWKVDDGACNIWSNRYISGTGWGTAELIETDNAGDAARPQVAIDTNNRAIAVWYQWDGTRDNIWANRYISGTGWATAELLETDNAGGAWMPQVVIDTDNNVIAIWYQSDGTRYNIWANRFSYE